MRARLRLAPPGDAPDTFVYDPADPTPSAGGPLLQPPGKQVDNQAIEARPDVLTYTSEPLAADVDLVGPVSARIFVRTGRRHADVFVRVCDVDDKGVSRNIVDGIRRLSPQTVPAADVAVGDDGVLAVDVELYPTGYRVLAGHRIRVQVSGGAFPRFARNFGTGEPFATATAGGALPVRDLPRRRGTPRASCCPCCPAYDTGARANCPEPGLSYRARPEHGTPTRRPGPAWVRFPNIGSSCVVTIAPLRAYPGGP